MMFSIVLFAAWILTLGITLPLMWVNHKKANAIEEKLQRLEDQDAVLKLAIDVVGFAVGNCSYYEIRNWPHDKLRQLADLMHKLGLFEDHHQHEVWKDFAAGAAGAEALRAKKPKISRDATGADWEAARQAFEKEFGCSPAAYKQGGLVAMRQASEPKK